MKRSSYASQLHFPPAVLFQISLLTRSTYCQGNGLLCHSPTEEYPFSLCVYKKVRVKTTACFQSDPCLCPQGRTQGSRALWGPAGWQSFVWETRGLRLFCHSTPQPGSVQLGQFCLTAETRLSAWKFTLCELGHWQLNLWVLNSSCSEQRSRLFNLSGFKKSEVFKLLEHIVLPMPAVSG